MGLVITLTDQMAKTPEAVYGILDDLAPKALAKAKIEAQAIQAEIIKDGKDFTLEAWDWAFYTEKVRQARLDLDPSLVKPYLELSLQLQAFLWLIISAVYTGFYNGYA